MDPASLLLHPLSSRYGYCAIPPRQSDAAQMANFQESFERSSSAGDSAPSSPASTNHVAIGHLTPCTTGTHEKPDCQARISRLVYVDDAMLQRALPSN